MTRESSSASSLPIVPTRREVVLPGSTTALEVGRPKSLRAIEAAVNSDNQLVLVPQRDPEVEGPDAEDLHPTGVLAEILQVHGLPAQREGTPGQCTLIVRALDRVDVLSFDFESAYLRAEVALHPSEVDEEDEEFEELVAVFRESLMEITSERAEPGQPPSSAALADPDGLVDFAVALLDLPRERLLELLSMSTVADRLRSLQPELTRLRDVLRARDDIAGELGPSRAEDHREAELRRRMQEIRRELGETDDANEMEALQTRISESAMSDEARAAAEKQLRRLRNMPQESAEHTVTRTYIENLLDVPWGKDTEDTLDLRAARAILDADHSGLDKVKKRIVEFIAVRKLAPEKHGPILCFVGPPGVGKTSLGRSIASALGRKYVRISLGGVRDDSEVRGHRRTYVGSMPGRIITGLKNAGSMNPVFVLDEIDKLSADHRGDPGAALLEVLDPEQNSEFVDHYMEVPIDLSRVMFIMTANSLATIPGPLLDRMEVIEVAGYTSSEKSEIARTHLLPKERVEHGLSVDDLNITDRAIEELIEHYVREAGVRNLQREIASLCRNAAVTVASRTDEEPIVIDVDQVTEVLGPRRFEAEMTDERAQVGVAASIGATPLGGLLLFIEARAMPGEGRFKLTGQPGDIMAESVQAALSFLRSRAKDFGIDSFPFDMVDLHVHIPSRSSKRDGASAGIAIASALLSLFKNQAARHDVAAFGEITLRGHILPVRDIKGRILTARRAGVKTLVMPERNRRDLEEVPPATLEGLEIRTVTNLAQALEVMLTETTPDVVDVPYVPAIEGIKNRNQPGHPRS